MLKIREREKNIYIVLLFFLGCGNVHNWVFLFGKSMFITCRLTVNKSAIINNRLFFRCLLTSFERFIDTLPTGFPHLVVEARFFFLLE